MSNPNTKKPIDTRKVTGGAQKIEGGSVIGEKSDPAGPGGYCGNPPGAKGKGKAVADLSSISGGGPYADETATNVAPKVDSRKVNPKSFDGGGKGGE